MARARAGRHRRQRVVAVLALLLASSVGLAGPTASLGLGAAVGGTILDRSRCYGKCAAGDLSEGLHVVPAVSPAAHIELGLQAGTTRLHLGLTSYPTLQLQFGDLSLVPLALLELGADFSAGRWTLGPFVGGGPPGVVSVGARARTPIESQQRLGGGLEVRVGTLNGAVLGGLMWTWSPERS